MKIKIKLKLNKILFFIFLFLIDLIKNETENNACETGLDVNVFNDCVGKSVSSNNSYCCYMHYSYLGPEAKYCMEFPKADIDNNKVKETINLIERGQYWELKIQTYDVISIICDYSFRIKKSFLYYFIYIFLLFLKL